MTKKKSRRQIAEYRRLIREMSLPYLEKCDHKWSIIGVKEVGHKGGKKPVHIATIKCKKCKRSFTAKEFVEEIPFEPGRR